MFQSTFKYIYILAQLTNSFLDRRLVGISQAVYRALLPCSPRLPFGEEDWTNVLLVLELVFAENQRTPSRRGGQEQEQAQGFRQPD